MKSFQFLSIYKKYDIIKDNVIRTSSYLELVDQLIRKGIYLGTKIILCIVIYYIGNKMFYYVNRFLKKTMRTKKIDPSLLSFYKSLINILLRIVLIFVIINILGFNNSSFVALLASVGVAFGMALSGTLQNFSGGVIILFFHPYRVGDYIFVHGQEGKVKEIQIFNTIIITSDDRTVFIPNGNLSTNVIVNYSKGNKRRIDWTFSVIYGASYDEFRKIIVNILVSDSRIFIHPSPFVFLKKLGDNLVYIGAYAWLHPDDYTSVYYDINKIIYNELIANKIVISSNSVIKNE